MQKPTSLISPRCAARSASLASALRTGIRAVLVAAPDAAPVANAMTAAVDFADIRRTTWQCVAEPERVE
ncbi:MAG TPA: hypothetical protein VFQ53_34270 [Kofleriaceae bacterium]|nr:hypothetical protein [Kofleriaceae bacterium]